ncbi:circadian clock protein KaiC [Ferrigenium kumadai]|uniref:non-specific serine/threonine protein kinase n=1 Tax=Ferrigenium kumadai TaxID=1682490 RepID=A0AAN1W0A7_9PROT|nr:circadian clock protein KaiC [Ferrigenium kumadai]BBI99092.1 circadian clock protein KaiC [Ferrigenium kumadai]
MRKKTQTVAAASAGLLKCPTGIPGLDQITNGGLPQGRTTLVCGGSGSGKTLFGMEFLVMGATEYGEHGVFMSFEENADELARNVASLGFDVQSLVNKKQLVVDHVRIERSEIEETGEYNLEGLFIRLGYAIDSVGAKRVVLDTIEALFAALANAGILRAELRRLFRWLKDKGVTAIVTGERGESGLTRHGLEEYVSDCVILLDQRVSEQVATRRLRIVKYRGSAHGTNEYPFLLDEQGFTVVPLTAISLQYQVPTDFVSTGIAKLDAMLGGRGYYRGGALLVSGTAGTGKSSIAAHFAEAACRRGERCLYCNFEESPDQFMRNMRSIGIDLKHWVDKGLLRFQAARPSTYGLEMHLAAVERTIDQFQPTVVAFDPVSSFEVAGSFPEGKAMLMRLVDFLKSRQITALFTSLTSGGSPSEQSEVGISSLIDIWLLLRNLEQGGERTRLLYVLKARGMAHSNQVREFLLTDRGVDLVEVYMGPNGILTGSSRAFQELTDEATNLALGRNAERRRLVIDHKRKALEARIAELQSEFEIERREMEEAIAEAEGSAQSLLAGRIEAGRQREGSASGNSGERK